MSVAIVLGVLGYLGTQVLAIGTVLQAVLGIDLLAALAVGLGVLAFYAIAGGIVAGVYTDLFQGLLMLGAAAAVLFQCLKIGGGMSAITETLWAMDPDYIGPWGTRGDLAAMSWMLLFGIGAAGQPHAVTKLMMLKDIRQLKWSALATGLSYLVLAMLWMGIGLAMRTLVARGDHPALENPDLAAPTFLLHYTPELLAGIVFAGLLAAIMSTADSFLNLGAAAVVRDIPLALRGRPLEHELMWSRIATGSLLLLSALFALYMENLIALLGTFGWGTFAAAIVPSICIGMNWKRATGTACVASIATSIALNFVLEVAARHGHQLLPPGLAVGAVALLAATAVFVWVSLLTPKRENLPPTWTLYSTTCLGDQPGQKWVNPSAGRATRSPPVSSHTPVPGSTRPIRVASRRPGTGEARAFGGTVNSSSYSSPERMASTRSRPRPPNSPRCITSAGRSRAPRRIKTHLLGRHPILRQDAAAGPPGDRRPDAGPLCRPAFPARGGAEGGRARDR